jgi:hypothetical protein
MRRRRLVWPCRIRNKPWAPRRSRPLDVHLSTCRDDAAQPRCSSGPMLPFTAILHHVAIPQIYEEGTSSVHTEPAYRTLSAANNSLPSPRPCSLETKRCARGSLRSRVFKKHMCDEWKVFWCVKCIFIACCSFIINRPVLVAQLRKFRVCEIAISP